ncbi:MFS general substrate transporter [Kockovaella imperatae]|uniref:MFS general substrate transporter n=1 Tax=Kockovaella imperatae TaxID=4999 RepID=A0A1Y1U7T9_9TREE|nr:MFS general substrate transporter [Kockovaella imperatae]ORX34072.1 MFS general substrate transporter [Kockovaella imperatae]
MSKEGELVNLSATRAAPSDDGKDVFTDTSSSEDEGEDLQQLYRQVLRDRSASEQDLFIEELVYTKEEEGKVIRKLDTRLFTAVLLSTFVLNIDRTNISNAISAGLPQDLGFTINTVNTAKRVKTFRQELHVADTFHSQVYAVIFTIATLFGAVVGKFVGPHRYIPLAMFSWGIVTLAHAAITNEAGYFLVRSFIALTEGGVIPATLVYLGTFYKSDELVTRLSWFWGIQAVASAVSGIMASGLLRLHGVRGLYGWKWLFLVDGALTLTVAVWLWFYLPGSVATTAGGLRTISRTEGWFDERQQSIAVTRTIRDDPNKLKYLTTRVTLYDIKDALTDRHVWAHLILTMIGLTPGAPLGTYLPTVIKSFKYSVFAANALTAPVYILQCISMVLMGWHSDKTKERGLHGLFGATWFLVGFVILRVLPEDAPRGAKYAGALIAGSWPQTHSLNIGWMTENTAGVAKRTVASGAIIGAANIYAVWASQIYRADDSPQYKRGNDINIAFCGAAIILWILIKLDYKRTNRKRVQRWQSLPPMEKQEVAQRAELEGSRSLLFKFVH